MIKCEIGVGSVVLVVRVVWVSALSSLDLVLVLMVFSIVCVKVWCGGSMVCCFLIWLL